MKYEQFLGIIKDLAKSQGRYARMLDGLTDKTDEEKREIETYLQERNIKDPVDLILELEG
jgi:hypothetical protein